MPRLSDAMEEGTILKWLVAPGDVIAAGTPLLEVETDKANVTYDSEVAGVIEELTAAEGDSVAVGAAIATIGDQAPAKPARKSPAAKAPAAAARGKVQTTEPTRLQRSVSRRMAESKATAPDYSMHLDVDMTACVALRERMDGMTDPLPTLNDMVVKAAANALREFPRVNGAYRDGRFESYSRVNVGIVVAAGDALVVPTIFDADERSLGEIARRSKELIEKVRNQSIEPPELAGGTFTVSNLGMYGIDSFSAVINPPQAATLAVGAVKPRPVVDEHGRIVVRQTMRATLTCDNRILYGADSAAFLARVGQLLENTAALAL
ncbi:MAG: hypothetical protein QOG62_2286 [Thermoleophilaceae bacterium]|jgi:pyruvate dehydrogenase E2 component (dihydrolipoamide acetyltransferase)|nr:hypothetical protein [Thermoleophilaceae bacterium]